MRKILKYLGIIALVLFIGLAAVAMYIKNKKPDVGPPEDITVEKTEARIEHGRYLANSVAVCMDCHSQRDFSVFAGPLRPETFGMGGEKFGKEMGFPGTVYSKNITPHAIGSWTDGEIFRAITTGVTKDGTALFPLMPFTNYGKMDKEDILSIIAYIRSLKPGEGSFPEKELDFPLNFLINTMPVKASLTTKPDATNTVAYGGYLVNAGGCMSCHSVEEKGAIVEGTEFGGGRGFGQPNGVMRSANITPHEQTGIGTWSRDAFIKRFKMYADSTYQPQKLNPDDVNTPMPWLMYATMTQQDLGAIYDYLRTVKPIENNVVKIEKVKK